LHEAWSTDGPRAYLGMLVPNFPNMFTVYGPNAQPVSGGTSLPSWYVIWSAYSAQCIVRMIETGRSRIEVKQEAFSEGFSVRETWVSSTTRGSLRWSGESKT